MNDYTFNRINKSSLLSIKYLYLKCFNFKVKLSALKKKYDTSLFGAKDIGYLAIAVDGTPAAYYGVFPISAYVGGQEILVAQSGDTMTHPDHQKRGLFVGLAKKTYELAEVQDIKFIYGFPNENSYPGFLSKLDWKFIGLMKKFIFKTSHLPLCEIAEMSNYIKKLYLIYVQICLNKYNIKFDDSYEFITQGSNRIMRNAKFINYKLRNPHCFFINYMGFKLLIKVENHLTIGDVEYFDESNIKDFICTIKKLGAKLMCGKTILNISENFWLFKYLKDNQHYVDNLPIGFRVIDNKIDYNKFSFTNADFDTF